MAPPLFWKFALRELRGGLKGFRIFLACLALGVAVIAAVGSLGASVGAGLERDARSLLGGDVELHLVQRPAGADELAYLQSHGAVSRVGQMRSMARTLDGDRRSLVELKSVDASYPLYGAVTVSPDQPLAGALAKRDGQWGAVVAPSLLDRLGLKLGDSVRIGDAPFILRATLAHEPDAIGGLLEFGPRVMVSAQALAESGLVAPGTLIGYAYRVRLPAGSDSGKFVAALRRDFPQAGWRIREFGNAAPSLQRLLDRLTVFMTLVGLTALLVGGVGIGNAVSSYLAGKTETIATFKCLGAPRRLVFATYLCEILILAAGGIVIGLALGALTPFLAIPLLPAQLPVSAQLGIYLAPLLEAACFGVLTTLAFALWPLGAAAEVGAASLFRARVEPILGLPSWACRLAVAAAGLFLAVLAVATATDRPTAFWAVSGGAAALLVFRLAGAAMVLAARRAGRPHYPGLRLALANLHRPGAPTAGVLASLGLGLAVLVAIALVQGNLAAEIDSNLPARAPSFFFIDIQPDQAEAFDRLLHDTPGTTELARVPSLRGRIVKLNGVPVEEVKIAPEAQWALLSDRGLTYSATPPLGSRIVAGTWWPADYKGPPLVSFDAELARGMGLSLGDTLTVNVLGRELTARIASLREIDWTSLGLNFAIVMSPGSLEGAPQMHIATARTAPENEAALARAVTDRFPNVSPISVKDALAGLSEVIASIAAALSAIAGVALAAGGLVLAGAIAAGHRRRVYEAVVLKVLGATRRDVTRVFLIEYGLIGLSAALIAAAIGTLAAYLLLTRVMHASWEFLPGVVLGTVAAATLFTLVAGYAGTWRALGAKAAPFLRNE